MAGNGGVVVHTRTSSHPFAFACIACNNNWFEGGHSQSRIHRCHVALSCFPKVYFLSHLSEVWDTEPHTFGQNHQAGWGIGDSVCDNLIGLDAFTGCDIVSAFAIRVKWSAFKLMKRDITYQETFIQIGQSRDVQLHLFEKVQQFTCRMHVAPSSTTKVNDLRYQQLCCAKRGDIESSLLPPCSYCVFMHLILANYQAAS